MGYDDGHGFDSPPHRGRRDDRPGDGRAPRRSGLIVSRPTRDGGYCKTVRRRGSSGLLRALLPLQAPRSRRGCGAAWPSRRSASSTEVVHRLRRQVDRFPFQKNIHQLPQDEFIECLTISTSRRRTRRTSGRRQREHRRAAASRRCSTRASVAASRRSSSSRTTRSSTRAIRTLDKDAMGRFFPHANVSEIIANMRDLEQRVVQRSLHVPGRGAISTCAPWRATCPRSGSLFARRSSASTCGGASRRPPSARSAERLISSAPLNRLLGLTGLGHAADVFSWNRCSSSTSASTGRAARRALGLLSGPRALLLPRRVLRQHLRHRSHEPLRGARVPDRRRDRRGRRAGARAARSGGRGARRRAPARRPPLRGDGSGLRPHHPRVDGRAGEGRAIFAANGIYSIGRYGGWTYCSIEDNIVEARALAAVSTRLESVSARAGDGSAAPSSAFHWRFVDSSSSRRPLVRTSIAPSRAGRRGRGPRARPRTCVRRAARRPCGASPSARAIAPAYGPRGRCRRRARPPR